MSLEVLINTEPLSRRLFLRTMKNGVLYSCAAAAGLRASVSDAELLKPSAADEELYISTDLLKESLFTSGIEGPACDINGILYAVSYGAKETIGMVTPDGVSSLFATLPDGSAGNGIRFDSQGHMLIADYTGHNVLKIDMQTREVSVYAHEPSMNQPNDLAIGANDILYASDPDWNNSTGNIWRIDTDGAVTLLESGMGTTNGIEVSPDERILYVNESRQRNVWAYALSSNGDIGNKRLLIGFPDYGMDGMRCDVDGNLYITRTSTGTVVKVSPDGTVLLEIKLRGKSPSNIAFGGPDGCTCYVTMADRRTIETFRVDKPGRSWKLYQERQPTAVAEHIARTRDFTLTGNYPNPFNASTTISYTLMRKSRIEVAVFNTLGQKIAVLSEGIEQAGNHTVRWDAGQLPSGMYICMIRANGLSGTRKMTLVK